MFTVETSDLSKWYGKNETEVKALNKVNLQIKKGEFISVVGHSGSGKSTLMHLLGGVDKPSFGKVLIDNEDIYEYTEKELAIFRRRKIGFIFQFYNLLPALTAEENIVLPLLMDKRRIDKEYLAELINFLGLSDRKEHLPSELSGGQQQRVSIGRALINRPSIILADEPTGNLDSKNSRDILNLLKLTAKNFNQTLMIVTHDKEIAAEANRVITVEDGMISKERDIR